MTVIVAAPIMLLNATYEPLSTVTLHRAIRLLSLGKAVIEEADDQVVIRSAGGQTWPLPRILRLVRYIKLAYDKICGPPQVSKRGVLQRDNHACGYCGEHANTVDHVQPRSRGGKTTWLNLVASCRSCNNRKRDRTPVEAKMVLRATPYAPKRKIAGHLGLLAAAS